MSKPKSQPSNQAIQEKTREETERVIHRLRTALRLLGFTNREIERRLGYTPSYLTRLLSGQIELRFEHIVDIAAAMGMTAEEFFQFAYPVRAGERSEPASKLAEMLEELRPGKNPEWTKELQQTVTRLFVEHMDKIIPKPPSEGVGFISPRGSASSSKRSRKS